MSDPIWVNIAALPQEIQNEIRKYLPDRNDQCKYVCSSCAYASQCTKWLNHEYDTEVDTPHPTLHYCEGEHYFDDQGQRVDV